MQQQGPVFPSVSGFARRIKAAALGNWVSSQISCLLKLVLLTLIPSYASRSLFYPAILPLWEEGASWSSSIAEGAPSSTFKTGSVILQNAP